MSISCSGSNATPTGAGLKAGTTTDMSSNGPDTTADTASGVVPTVRSADSDRKYLLERVDEAAVVQLYADGFEALPSHQRVLIWHLYQAAIAGRDIFYDQRYAHNLEMRDVLEEIVTHPAGIEPRTLAEIQRDRKSTRLNSSHLVISYAVFCLKKKKKQQT